MLYIPGVKTVNVKSARAIRRATVVLERIRSRYERFVRIQYTKLLKSIYEEILNMDHIPSELEVYTIIQDTHEAQEHILRRMMDAIYPEATLLATPDDKIKCIQGANGIEVKDTDRNDAVRERFDRWMDENLGAMIRSGYYDDMTDAFMSDMWYIDDTTMRDIRKAMDTAHGDPYLFQQEVQKVLGSTPQRAYTIARTETARASNVAMRMAAEEYSFGRPMTKTWITVGGPNVRASHRAMDDVTIDNNEFFSVPNIYGGYDTMLEPLDGVHGATASNIINCRCWCVRNYED